MSYYGLGQDDVAQAFRQARMARLQVEAQKEQASQLALQVSPPAPPPPVPQWLRVGAVVALGLTGLVLGAAIVNQFRRKR